MSRSIKNNRKRWTLLGAFIGMATTLALVVGLGVFAGSGSAASSAKPGNTNPPSISGTAQENNTLTADNGSWKNGVNKYAYFWTRCDKTGASCANISGAHALKYVVTSTDVGNTLRFKVQATNGDGSTTATSVPTAVVVSATKPPPPPLRPAARPAPAPSRSPTSRRRPSCCSISSRPARRSSPGGRSS